MAKKPQSTMLTLSPKMLEDIVKNYIRDMQIEAEAGEHEARSVNIEFKDFESWDDIATPAVQASIFF